MKHQGLERLRVPLRRCEIRCRAVPGSRQPQERGEERDELGGGLDIALEQGFELRKLLERIIPWEKACGILQLSDYRMEGAGGAFGRTLVGHQPMPAIGSELLLQRLQQPGLSDSRLAGEPYYLTFAVLRQIPAVEQQVEFLSPSDQGCGLRSVQCLEPALARLLTQNLMGAHGGVEALGANRCQLATLKQVAKQAAGLAADDHGIRLSQRLKTRSKIRSLADYFVFVPRHLADEIADYH